MRVTRRRFVAISTSAALVAKANPTLAQGVPKGTMVFIVQPEPPNLALFSAYTAPTAQVASKVYEGLLDYDAKLQPTPRLATMWDISEDRKTITFKLTPNATFHDGAPFTSADVRFSILDVLRKYHPRGPVTFRDLEDIATPDPHTAVFRLKTPAPYLMSALSGDETPMLPKHLINVTDVVSSKVFNAPVGTGPFKFVEWKKGQYIRLDKNEKYWKSGLPNLDRIVIRFISDAGTRRAALETGDAHAGGQSAIYNPDVRVLEKLPYIKVTTEGYDMLSPIVKLYYNTTKPPFDSKKVRQALSYAIDRSFVIDNIWFGYGKPATGPLSSNFLKSGLYTKDVHSYVVDDKIGVANRLLDEAGYPRKANGIRFEIVHDILPYGEEWRKLGEYDAQLFGQLGIKTTIRYEDVASWLRRIYTDYDFDVTAGWLSNLADPVLGIHREYHSAHIRKGVPFVNASRWSTPRTDELMDLATSEADPAKRATLYHEFQRIVVEEAPQTWISELLFTTVYRNSVRDLITNAQGIYGSFEKTAI